MNSPTQTDSDPNGTITITGGDITNGTNVYMPGPATTPTIYIPPSPHAQLHFSDECIAVIKKMYGANLTPAEWMVFLHVCQQRRLDPRLGQICTIKFSDRMLVYTTIDGLRLIADRTGCYAPGQDTEYAYDQNGALMHAKVYVKKRTNDGTWHQISSTAFLAEYRGKKGLWQSMPSVMLSKCAEAQALRRAFPAELSGLYAEDELDKAREEATNPRRANADNASNTPTYISQDKIQAIQECVAGCDDLIKLILRAAGVKSIDKITEEQLPAVRNMIRAHRAGMSSKMDVSQSETDTQTNSVDNDRNTNTESLESK